MTDSVDVDHSPVVFLILRETSTFVHLGIFSKQLESTIRFRLVGCSHFSSWCATGCIYNCSHPVLGADLLCLQFVSSLCAASIGMDPTERAAALITILCESLVMTNHWMIRNDASVLATCLLECHARTSLASRTRPKWSLRACA